MELCVCGTGGGNTGRPSCFPVFDVTKQVVLVEYFKSDGSINGIDLSTLSAGVLDQAFLDARVKDVDPKLRWFPTPELKNITDERADDITEEFEDTTSVFIQVGARTFTGVIIKGDPVLLGNLKTWRCVSMGAFFIDKTGNLIGKKTRDGFLDPIKIQDESFSAGLIKGTDTTKQKASVSFIVDALDDDSDLRMIEASNITANLKGVNGLINVNATAVTSITTAGFTVQLDTDFGGVTSLIPAEGMELADFQANELTPTPGAEPIATVTESAVVKGQYAFVWTTPVASGDVHQISNPSPGPLTKNFDLKAFNVTTP